MGRRVLIPVLVALLLAAGVSAWLLGNPASPAHTVAGCEAQCGMPGVSVNRGTSEQTSRAHGQDAHATSGASTSSAGNSSRAVAPVERPAETAARRVEPLPGAAPESSEQPEPLPPGDLLPTPQQQRRHIIDAPRPENQTLGNEKPRSRGLKNGKPFKTLEEVSEKLKQDRRGLYAQYYAFQSDPLMELASEKAVLLANRDANLVRIDNQVFFPDNAAFSDLPFNLGNFAAVWEGYFVVPEQGEYWLFLGADNAARVDLDGETVLLNDVKSRYIEVSTVLELAPGLHPIHIEFAQGILANEDSWRCACSFMWLPKGQQKPVAVPPEMLMVPDWMWSADAPIITKLSKYEGEIGDVITIYGRGLASSVCFNGQNAFSVSVAIDEDSEIQVRIPIGASTGKLVVLRGRVSAGSSGRAASSRTYISNSVDFKVTTQFGLLARWYNLASVPSNGFVDPEVRQPDLTRIEPDFMFDSISEVGLPPEFGGAVACRWEGRLGLVASSAVTVISIWGFEKIRVSLGGEVRDCHSLGQDEVGVGFELPPGDDRFVAIVVDFAATSKGSFGIGKTYRDSNSGVTMGYTPFVIEKRFFFPPITPPQPPRIASVTPIQLADEAALPPFSSGELPSVREGQQCRIEVVISTILFASKELDDAPITLMIDGHVIDAGTGSLWNEKGIKTKSFTVTIPPGCGEGKLTARLGLSVSEPFYIDVANKGLIAYLYDLPNPSGYEQFPDVEPLTCHSIRKDRDINFETAASFALPFIAETFAVEWFGAVIIEKEGWYTFTTRSDDGVRVWLNGQEIIDDDNLHAPHEKSSERIKLVPGTYTFRMQFFENNQHEVCTLSWQADDLQENEIIPKQVVPKKAFTWEVHDQLPNKQATRKRADGSDAE